MAAISSSLSSDFPEITQIRKGRLDSPLDEISRLFKFALSAPLSCEKENHIRNFLYARMVYFQSRAIQSALEDTHDVFLHAQSTNWLPFIYTIKALFKMRYPSIDCRNFKFLRIPKAHDFERLAKYRSGGPLTKSPSFITGDGDSAVREDLISASVGWKITDTAESALDFLLKNTNFAMSPDTIEKACKSAICHFCPHLSSGEANLIVRSINAIFQKAQRELDQCGSLFLIAIPKEQREDGIYYRAHRYGFCCTCKPNLSESEILDRLQSRDPLDLTGCSQKESIQYRLYVPLLQPGKHRIYHLTALSRANRRQLKAGIGNALSQITRPPAIPRNPSEICKAALLFRKLQAYSDRQPLLISTTWHVISYLS